MLGSLAELASVSWRGNGYSSFCELPGLSSSSCEDGHLGWGAQSGIFWTDGLIARPVLEAVGDAVGPLVELVAGPFEAVIRMAEVAPGQGFPVGVVLGVGRGDEYGGRTGAGEDDASQAARRGGSRCSITSMRTAAS